MLKAQYSTTKFNNVEVEILLTEDNTYGISISEVGKIFGWDKKETTKKLIEVLGLEFEPLYIKTEDSSLVAITINQLKDFFHNFAIQGSQIAREIMVELAKESLGVS